MRTEFHMFWKDMPGKTYRVYGLDMSRLYGLDMSSSNQLSEFTCIQGQGQKVVYIHHDILFGLLGDLSEWTD